jgi:hypothetical protein
LFCADIIQARKSNRLLLAFTLVRA